MTHDKVDLDNSEKDLKKRERNGVQVGLSR